MSTVEELKKETIYLHILSVDAKHDEISGTGRDDWNAFLILKECNVYLELS